jgi:hypothetical protein
LIIVSAVRAAKLRDVGGVFFVVSGEVWFFLTTHWIVHPAR